MPKLKEKPLSKINPRKITSEEKSEIAKLYLEGKTLVEIAACFELCPQSVANSLQRQGIARRKWPRNGVGHHNWAGGKKKHPDGYLYALSNGHPFATADGYVLEHRLVMEKCVGRFLLPSEIVHHKNENKTDNRIENLEITSRGTHIRHHHRKYSDATERGILQSLRESTYKKTAVKFGVSESTISNMRLRQSGDRLES